MKGRTRAVAAMLGLVGILAVALTLPVAGASGETAVVAGVGSGSPVEFQFGLTPRRLPPGDPGATTLKLGLEMDPVDEGAASGIATTTIGLDRSIVLEPRGLPICFKPGVEGGVQVDAAGPDECGRAVVGRVEAKVFFDFPETSFVTVPTAGRIYNAGPRPGGSNLLIEIPIAGTFDEVLWLVAKVRSVAEGRLGSEMTIRVPEIAGGNGLLTALHLELGRAFRRDGERVGYVEARCDRGRVFATESTRSSGGGAGQTEAVQACGRRAG